MSLFWRFYNWAKKKYIKQRYKGNQPEIIYDNNLHGYVHPSFDEERFDIEELAEELCDKGLCYEFQIGGEYDHHHELHRVIEDAYNYGSQFTIPFECESDYSRQELNLLRKLAWQGDMDRQKWRVENDIPLPNITMSEDDPEEDEVTNPINYMNNNVEDYSWQSF